MLGVREMVHTLLESFVVEPGSNRTIVGTLPDLGGLKLRSVSKTPLGIESFSRFRAQRGEKLRIFEGHPTAFLRPMYSIFAALSQYRDQRWRCLAKDFDVRKVPKYPEGDSRDPRISSDFSLSHYRAEVGLRRPWICGHKYTTVWSATWRRPGTRLPVTSDLHNSARVKSTWSILTWHRRRKKHVGPP
ncbi:hypothetical protein DFH06DRAFT_1132128 [Mycena polygramma]|nr:hypothetical protein DFH06DRAFT_1132128 [Mycena polygramma]